MGVWLSQRCRVPNQPGNMIAPRPGAHLVDFALPQASAILADNRRLTGAAAGARRDGGTAAACRGGRGCGPGILTGWPVTHGYGSRVRQTGRGRPPWPPAAPRGQHSPDQPDGRLVCMASLAASWGRQDGWLAGWLA